MGIFLSLLAAILDALRGALNKKSLEYFDEYFLAWTTSFLGFIFLLPGCFFLEPIQHADGFWINLFIVGVINAITTIWVLRALRLGDLSLVAPLRSFSPFFLLFTAPFILGELPDTLGLLGVILIVVGSYFLEFKSFEDGLFSPVKSLWSKQSARLMIACTLLWSISSCFAKLAIVESDSYFFTTSLFGFISLFLTPAIIIRRSWRNQSGRNSLVVMLSLLLAGAHLATWSAFTFTLAVYVLSIKRLGLIIGVVIGRFYFKEPRFMVRMTSCIVMVIGTVLIAL